MCMIIHLIIMHSTFYPELIMYHFLVQAFKKMNKELKKEQIEILKTKYGIDVESDQK